MQTDAGPGPVQIRSNPVFVEDRATAMGLADQALTRLACSHISPESVSRMTVSRMTVSGILVQYAS